MGLEKPTYSRETYEKTESEMEQIADSVDESTPLEELRQKSGQMEGLATQKESLHNEAWDQAHAENALRDAQESSQKEAAELLERMRTTAGRKPGQTEAGKVASKEQSMDEIDEKAVRNGWEDLVDMPPERVQEIREMIQRKDHELLKTTDNERIREIGKQVESVSAPGSRSAERLRHLHDEANLHPEYFGGDEKLSQSFWARVQEKAKDLHQGPELMEKKEKFWEKWKMGSMVAAAGGVVAGIGGAVWASKYGFDHTYMKEMFGVTLNVPMVAGFAAAAVAEGSAGIGKLMEMIKGNKRYDLKQNLRANNI